MTEKNSPPQISVNEEKELLSVKYIKSEVNFARLPFFALSRRGVKDKIKVEYKNIIERDGQKLEVLWKVTANAEYGYPTPFDKKVSKAIEYIINESGFPISNPIKFSLYKIAELVNFKASEKGNYSGNAYKDIKESLVRIVGTMIESRGTFYSKGRKKWISDVFHLYDRVVLKGEDLPEVGIADANYLFLSSWYLESLNSFYIKPLDFNYYQSLKSNLAGRLYEFLSVQFYGSKGYPYQIEYNKLCLLMPIEQQMYLSLAKQAFSNAHEELVKTKFLSHVVWEELNNKKWIIRYYPGKRVKDEIKQFKIGEQLELSLSNESTATFYDLDTPTIKNNTTTQLMQRSITESVAENLINSYPPDQIQKQIEIFDHLVETNSPLVAKNPAGFLRKSIEENYQPPAEYNRKQEKEITEQKRSQERIEKEVEQARLDEIQRQVDEYRDSLNDEERQLLRQETIELIESDKQIRREFVTEHLIRAKENEIIRERGLINSFV